MLANTLLDTANKAAKVPKWFLIKPHSQAQWIRVTIKSHHLRFFRFFLSWDDTFKSFQHNKYLWQVISVRMIIFSAHEHFSYTKLCAKDVKGDMEGFIWIDENHYQTSDFCYCSEWGHDRRRTEAEGATCRETDRTICLPVNLPASPALMKKRGKRSTKGMI